MRALYSAFMRKKGRRTASPVIEDQSTTELDTQSPDIEILDWNEDLAPLDEIYHFTEGRVFATFLIEADGEITMKRPAINAEITMKRPAINAEIIMKRSMAYEEVTEKRPIVKKRTDTMGVSR